MLVENISPINSGILNELFNKYYLSPKKSRVTSSYWEEYGAKNTVNKSGGKFIIQQGHALGVFVRSNLLNYLKQGIPSLLSKSLLTSFAVEKNIKAYGYDVAKKQKRMLVFDVVKQIIICNLINNYKILEQSKTIVVIGDGYGFMASLLKLAAPHAKIICVNLGKILFFDLLFASKVFPHTKMVLLKNNDNYGKMIEQNPLIFLEAENYEILFRKPVDLFVNIASMQEMNPSVIKMYFNIIRSSTGKKYFYSCNRVEKTLPDGTVVRFDEYPWDPKNDTIIFDELSAFYQKYPVSIPPFWLPFDGPVKHRLVKMG